jgi:hypothetical protein
MKDDVVLRLTGRQKKMLHKHLFPDDGMEAVALLLCGRHQGHDRHCLSVREVVLIPYDVCNRYEDRITWPTSFLEPLLLQAEKYGLAVVKVHSHPGGYDRFSGFDDVSDRDFFAAASSWTESEKPHASVVMLPCGRMFGRIGLPNQGFADLDLISVAGDDIEYWADDENSFIPDFGDRHAQVLGSGTFAKLRRLRVAVVGCSGTGSPTIEQLFRLGVGELVLVDPDSIGPENLNRIINSRGRHGTERKLKVAVIAEAIEDTELGTTVYTIASDLCTSAAVKAVASCDMIFGCVDSVFARHLLNKIASTYCIPYIDIGVGLRADGMGGISHATGAVHYLQPDGSSLLSRGVFDLEDVRAEAMRRLSPDEHASRLQDGYIKGADVRQPAVMPINVIFSGYGVWEFLCRLHPLRDEDNSTFACQRWSLTGSMISKECDGDRCHAVSRYMGYGDMNPLLGLPELSLSKAATNATS